MKKRLKFLKKGGKFLKGLYKNHRVLVFLLSPGKRIFLRYQRWRRKMSKCRVNRMEAIGNDLIATWATKKLFSGLLRADSEFKHLWSVSMSHELRLVFSIIY